MTTIAQIVRLQFWRAYWITMRPYLLFVSGVAGMTGVALADSPAYPGIFLAFICFFFSYGFGQALTDCFQIDTDSLSSPYRPLVKGIIRRSSVMAISLFGLLGSCIILFHLNPLNLVFGLVATVGLLTYTWFKRRWWGGPFWNAWIVGMLPVMGFYSFSNKGLDSGQATVFVLILTTTLFRYANFVLMGYFKDISADRASGYFTFNVVFGWRASAFDSDVLAAVSVLSTALVIYLTLSHDYKIFLKAVALLPFIAAIIVLVAAQINIHKIRDEHLAFAPIEHVVRGFILLHLAEILVLKPHWMITAAVFYMIFEIVLMHRPMKEQV